ncbi:MAG: hypothetical protein H7X83_03060 [Verrucomicrobia bacterium]|nr:hypothetical protein [Deltaproteobacteria bacterium]
MKRAFFCPSRAFVRILSTVITIWMLMVAGAWGATAPAGLFSLPLNQILVPEPPNLFQFVKNKPAAILLGKALFWDMQAGSDGVQACGSCHFHAGADNRLKNSVNPGTRAVPVDTTFQVRGPNDILLQTDFPFHQRQNPDFKASPVIRDANDVVGSQGVKLADFVAINAGSAVDIETPVNDTIFHVGGVNMRQVTARNTPSVINAVFNFNNFWDGRAHFIFNGVNPFGPQDTTAGVWFSDAAGIITKQKIEIEMASLASQATGPPLDTTEMSFRGRTFPQLGRKMLSLTPLGKQVVHPNDSELGIVSRADLLPDGSITGGKGLSINYTQMIKSAFLDKFWNSNQLTPEGFTQMEANFSLFWGLAIQLYEATLVSDQTPFDRLLGGDSTALTAQEEIGMNIFFGAGKCNVCHAGTELTTATATTARFVTNLDNGLIDQMPVASGLNTIYDIGYNATGVRPMTNDIGRGGNSPFFNPLTGLFTPLSFCAMAELQANPPLLGGNKLPFASIVLPLQIPFNFPISNNAAFKVPGLRNVELTAPYFHDGSVMTLEDLVDFYTRGGNFPSVTDNPHLDFNMTEIGTLQNDPGKMAAMVAFMKTLTDERVRNEAGPFDHPEIFIPNGDPEVMIRLPAKDLNGVAAPSLPIVTLIPVTSPTGQTNQLISGTKESGATIQVKVNNGQAFPADTATDTTWSTTVTGFVSGNNTVTITATDVAAGVTTLTSNILVNVPTFTIRSGAGPNGSIVQAGVTTLPSGANRTYTITPNPGFTVSALSVDGVVLAGATTHTFTNVSANHYINAYFAPAVPLTITATAAGVNGSISPAGATTVTSGSNQTYTITPNTGFMVTALSVDGVILPAASSHTFSNVQAKHYINAYFGPIPATVTITATAGLNGSISSAGATQVAGGSNQTYTITPNLGFAVAALSVDGVVLPGATSYTFTNVTGNHYINAYFRP